MKGCRDPIEGSFLQQLLLLVVPPRIPEKSMSRHADPLLQAPVVDTKCPEIHILKCEAVCLGLLYYPEKGHPDDIFLPDNSRMI